MAKSEIPRVAFKGKTYPVMGFNELSGGDWRRLTHNLERGVEFPDQLERVLRACLTVWVPSASRDMRKWDTLDIMHFLQAVLPMVTLEDGPEIMKRYMAAQEQIVPIIKERFAVEE